MYLYHVEYQILKNQQTFTCKVVGDSEKDVVNDIESQVGKITVNEFYYQTEVHRISRSIRERIIEQSLMKHQQGKTGRPRKYEVTGD